MATTTQRVQAARVRSITAAVVAVAVTVAALASCGSDEPAADAATAAQSAESVAAAPIGVISAQDAWTRVPPPGQTNVAVYGVVANRTDDERRIIAVTSSFTDRAELHETLIGPNGIAVMQPRNGGFELAAESAVLFEPGGAHIMLRDIDRDRMSPTLDITLEFDDGSELTVEVEVRGASARSDADAEAVAD